MNTKPDSRKLTLSLALTMMFLMPLACGTPSNVMFPTFDPNQLQTAIVGTAEMAKIQTLTASVPEQTSPLLPTLANASTLEPIYTPEQNIMVEPINTDDSLNNPYNETALPQKDIEEALIDVQKDGKLVLLDFGANWCPDCLVLAKLFEDLSVQPYLQDNFRVVRIDVGKWDKNLDISQLYGNPIDNGIPAVVVLLANGDIIATTKDGGLANARTATPQEILDYLKLWVSKKP